MLIVIAIMLLLVAAAATIMPAATESRRVREAARGLNVYLSSARNRAMESGRSCGVTFHFLTGTPCTMNLDQCEVPPTYEGVTQQSVAQVTINSGAGPGPAGGGAPAPNLASGTVTVNLANNEVLPPRMVRPGDLIQFNHQGEIFSITDALGNGAGTDIYGFFKHVSSFSAVAYDPNPWPSLPSYSSAVPFCIFRSPMKSGATPLQLPTASVVDFRDSGVGSSGYMGPAWNLLTTYNLGDTVMYNGLIYVSNQGGNIGHTPTTATYWQPLTTFTVLFSSAGAIDKVYYNAYQVPVTDPIYLMIGKRDRVANNFVANNGNESTLTNLQDLKNLWVAINPQTGLVNTALVGSSAAASNEANAVAPARQAAAQGIGIGGK
jgi:type II secretory pathway pseudopilin PulG